MLTADVVLFPCLCLFPARAEEELLIGCVLSKEPAKDLGHEQVRCSRRERWAGSPSALNLSPLVHPP
jgi:hypothetical protein